MINAHDAAKLTEDNLTRIIEKFRKTLENHILDAARQGLGIVTVKYNLPIPADGFVEELEELGYHVAEGMDDLEIEWM